MRSQYRKLPAVILALALAALVTGTVILRIVEQRLAEVAGENLALAAIDIAEKLDLFLGERYGDIQMMAQADVFQHRDTEAMTAYLHQVQRAYPSYIWLAFAGRHGRIIAATNPASLGQDRSRAKWFRFVRDEHGIRVQDVEGSEEVPGGLSVSFAAPVLGPRGDFVGAVVGQTGLSSLEDAFARTVFPMQAQQGTSGRIEYQFLASDGSVIVDSALRQEGSVNLKTVGLPSALRLETSPPGYVEEEHFRRRVLVITGYAQTRGAGEFRGLSWGVLVRRDKADVLAPIQDLLWRLGMAVGLVFVPTLGFLLWTSGRLRHESAQVRAEQERAAGAEAATREKARLLELFFKDSLTCFVLLDRDFNFIRVNEAYARACGRAAADFPGRNHFELYPSDAQAIFEEVRRTKTPFQATAWPFVFPDHPEWGVTYRDWTLVPILDDAGSLDFFVFSLNDVTERERAEQARRASEARFREMAEHIQDVIWMTDPHKHEMLYVSPAYETIWGCSRASLYAQPLSFLDAIHPEDRARVADAAHKQIKGTYDEEYRILRPDGSLRWIRDRAFPIRDGSGQVYRIVGIAEDMTEMKLRDEVLRLSHKRYEDLVNSLDGIVWEADARTFRFAFVSEQAERILGYPVKRWLEEPTFWQDHIHPEDRDRAVQYCLEQTALKKGHEFEYRMTAADGRIIWFRDFVTVEVQDDQPVTLRGVMVDVTERKLAEEAVRQSAKSLAEAQRIAHLGNWEWNVVTNELRWSDEIYRIFGLTPQGFNATYEAFLSSVHPDDRDAVTRAVEDALYRRIPYSIDHRIVLPGGKERIVHEQAEVAHDEAGRPVRMWGTVQDITEATRLADHLRQAQKMEAIGRLAGGIAHDFNNLLTVINGYSHLLLKGLGEQDPIRTPLEEILQAGERAAAMTHQLLAFSRKQVLRPQMVDLNQIVTKVERMLIRLIGEHIRLETRLATALDPARADPGQIEQVLVNLAVNARDAMPQGGTLSIETANVRAEADGHSPSDGSSPDRTAAGTSSVRLTVTDTGCGMDEHIRAHIFEPFFTTKELGHGTGLGLATVYGIVEQSGGTIDVRSQPGMGTSFIIDLPLAAHPPAPDAEAAAPEPRGGRETILVVEDQDEVRRLACTILQSKGYTVLEASGGEEALRLCQERRHPVTLLVTDVVMPGLDGRRLAERLTAQYPGLKVLYMSGYMDDVLLLRGILSADIAFLQKPFTPESLAAKVRKVLDAPTKP